MKKLHFRIETLIMVILVTLLTAPNLFSDPNDDETKMYFTIDTNFMFNYNMSAGNQLIPTITLYNPDKISDHFFFAFSRGNAPTFNQRQLKNPEGTVLNYQIYDSFNKKKYILQDLSSPNPQQTVLSGSVNKLEMLTIPFAIDIPKGQNVPAGMYSDTIKICLFDGQASSSGGQSYNPTPVMCQTVTFTTLSPGFAAMAILEKGASQITQRNHIMDFGSLEPQESLSCDAAVIANTGYTLTAQSSNRSNLVHTVDNISSIPYFFSFDGVQHSLSTGEPVVLVANTYNPQFLVELFDITIRIGNFTTAPSGLYKDIITFRITAN